MDFGPGWKLHLFTQKSYGQAEHDAHEPPLLFDLHADPGESFDLSANHPAVVADLLREIDVHRATVVPVASQLEAVEPPPAEAAKPPVQPDR